MFYNDHGTILTIFKNAHSEEQLEQALRKLGLGNLAKNETAMKILRELTSPFSERKKKESNELLNGQLELAAQELAEQFQAILLHNLKLRQLEAILLDKEGTHDHRRVEDDNKDKKIDAPEEPSLVEKLRKQDELIAKLEGEIKETDKQIVNGQQELITTLADAQQKQVNRFEQGRDALLEQLISRETANIAADDPDRENKIKQIQDKYSKDKIYISADDTEADKLLKNYNNIVQDYNSLLADTQEQIATLSSAQAIKMTNGRSLAQLLLKITLLKQYASTQFDALEKQAKEVLDLYKNHGSKIEAINRSLSPEKVADYNKYIQYERDTNQLEQDIKQLNKEIYALDKEIDQYNLDHPNDEPTAEIAKKLKEKLAKEQERTAKTQEIAAKGQAMIDLSATYDEVRKANVEANRLKNALGGTDPQTLAVMAQNAQLMLDNISEQKAQLKSIKAYSQEHAEKSGVTNKLMELLTRLFTSKEEKIERLQAAVEQKAEIILNMTSMKEAEVKQTQPQQASTVQPEPEQEQQTRPGMSPRPNSSSDSA